MATFRELFKNTPAGPAREQLVYDYAIRQGKPKTVPVTVKQGENELTYQIMPDYLMIENIRVPLMATTAEKIANYFFMILPNSRINQQVYNAAKQQGSALEAKPLSGKTTEIDGKVFTPQNVVNDVSRSDLAIAYSDQINNDPNYKKNKNGLVAGHMKTIVTPDPGSPPNRLWLHGLYGKSQKPIQGGSGLTPHDLQQTEYATSAYFLEPTVQIKRPDGTIETRTITPSGSYLPQKSKSQSTIDSSQKAGPPTGYVSAKLPPDIATQAHSEAKRLLDQPMWSKHDIEISGRKYVAKVEPHYNQQKGRHKGVSLYETTSQHTGTSIDKSKPDTAVAQSTPTPAAPYAPPTPSSSQTRMSLLNRVKSFFDELGIG
jgi:hypothetical protein